VLKGAKRLARKYFEDELVPMNETIRDRLKRRMYWSNEVRFAIVFLGLARSPAGSASATLSRTSTAEAPAW
jgi:hypothetical protein